nr:hypothetical protein K07C6.1 - Caenorhabditis elegans [Caenorhabditis elegans]
MSTTKISSQSNFQSFPLIVNQFHKMVKIAYFAFFMLIMLVVVMCLLLLFGTLLKQKFALQQLFTAWVIIIFGIAIILHILVYFVTLQVFHVLLFLLAIQNFLRFFVSLRLLFLQTSIQKYVKRIYIFFILKDFVSFLISKFDNKLPQNVWHAGQILYLVTLLILNLLLPMMSPLIYTPIIVKTKINNTDMYSQHHAHIHKYVFWQNVSVFSFKTVVNPFAKTGLNVQKILDSDLLAIYISRSRLCPNYRKTVIFMVQSTLFVHQFPLQDVCQSVAW